MQLQPYLHFNGDCETAFKYYERVLGGKIEAMMTHAGTPAEQHVPAEWRDKILHARLVVGDAVLMASDSPPGHYQKPQGFTVLIQDPRALEWFGRHEEPSAARAAGADYEDRARSAPTAADAQRILREWRRREMLRIAWRDIAGRAGVRETLHALSDFADAAIRAAASAARLQLQPVFGLPRGAAHDEVPLIVLGMGKLGGRELNFSSDIDLVFLFSEAGQTDGPREGENEEYFNRLGRELIRPLGVRNADGFGFP